MSSSRREFLKSALGASALAALGPTVPEFLSRTARAGGNRQDRDGTVLVVLQLSGGNDGLNTVVPYADDAYAKARSTLRLTGKQVHKINDLLGFHPQMQAFRRLYDEGVLSVVQGVAYPKSDRSHPGAMRDWHSAQPGAPDCQTGWVGRTADCACAPPSVAATFVGRIPQPFALNAEKSITPSIASLQPSALQRAGGPALQGQRHRQQELAAMDRVGQPDTLLDFVRTSTLQSCTLAERFEAAARSDAVRSDYPPFQLAGDLKTIARLVRAETGVRIFFAEIGGGGIGGFDNHANQRDNHAALLRQLAESVAAFFDDLKRDRLHEKVVLATFSEFGRTLSENGRRGTGHGEAAPMFLVGGCLKGGLVGAHPSLTQLNQDAPRFHTDFRRVYATLLDEWLGIDSEPVLGAKYAPLDVFRS